MKRVVKKLISVLFIVFTFGCSTQQQVEHQQIPEIDNKYDSEFPVKSISKQLDFVSGTIKKLDCLAFYMSYVFPADNTVDKNNITTETLLEQSVSNTITNESVTGTATVIYYDGKKVGLLTCAHVVNFPDTIITRYDNGDGPIEILSIKVKQQNFVKDLPEGEDVEVVATNPKDDIAFLLKKLDEHILFPEVLDYPIGNTKDLEWGSIVYVMGFPLGNKMVTRAIVSNPGKSNKNRFLTDALYNRGISGAPVLAIRDGVPNLEWVGMACSASAQKMYYLKPGNETPQYINPDEAYTGELFMDYKKTINYGVTFHVTIESVIDFLNDNRNLLESKGVDAKLLFN